MKIRDKKKLLNIASELSLTLHRALLCLELDKGEDPAVFRIAFACNNLLEDVAEYFSHDFEDIDEHFNFDNIKALKNAKDILWDKEMKRMKCNIASLTSK